MELYDAPFGPDQTYNRFPTFLSESFTRYLLMKESCERGSGKPTGSLDGPAELFILTNQNERPIS